jgi:hypothetical protein
VKVGFDQQNEGFNMVSPARKTVLPYLANKIEEFNQQTP